MSKERNVQGLKLLSYFKIDRKTFITILIYTILVFFLMKSAYSAEIESLENPETSRFIVKFNATSILDVNQFTILSSQDITSTLKVIEIPKEEISLLENNQDIEYFEEDKKIKLVNTGLLIFNDNLESLFQQETWNYKKVGANSTKAVNITGKGVKIAILDTGIDYTHPELNKSYKGGFDFYNVDLDPRDDHGHGTHMTGIISAGDNNEGIIGISPDSEIYALKVLNQNGEGVLSDVLLALQWIIDNDIDIASMSFGTPDFSQAFQDMIDLAFLNDIILVAAAGNNGNAPEGSSTLGYPARFQNVLAVSAVDSLNKITSFSSTGPEVDFSAPGLSVLSTLPNNAYNSLSGTSVSTPHVSGIAALYKEIFPDKTNIEIIAMMKEDAIDLGASGFDNLYGNGLINAFNLINLANRTPKAKDTLEQKIQNLESRVSTLEEKNSQLVETIESLSSKTNSNEDNLLTLNNSINSLQIIVNSIKSAICSLGGFSFCPATQNPPETPQCNDECSLGEKICSTSSSFKVCGQFDSDSCLEFGPSNSCSSGEICSEGLCVEQTPQCRLEEFNCRFRYCSVDFKDQNSCSSQKGCTWWNLFGNQGCSGVYKSCETREICQ